MADVIHYAAAATLACAAIGLGVAWELSASGVDGLLATLFGGLTGGIVGFTAFMATFGVVRELARAVGRGA